MSWAEAISELLFPFRLIISQGLSRLNGNMSNKVISVSKVLLTWPQCDGNKEELQVWLKENVRGYQCSIVCKEDHHETEGVHFHAVVKMKMFKARHDTVMKMFDWTGHHADIEFLKGVADVVRAVKYVMKDGDFVNDGVDVQAIEKREHKKKWTCRRVLETPIQTLVDEEVIHPRDFRSILQAQQIWKLLSKPDDCEGVRGIWLSGPAGCGKSTWARSFGISNGGYYEKPMNKWWDGYDGEPVVILDDLDTPALNHYLKIWGDKFACKGEVKGSTIWLKHRWLVVTSNYSICDIVKMGCKDVYDMELERALKRRFVEMDRGNNEFFVFEPPVSSFPSEPSIVIPEPPQPPAIVSPSDPEPAHYDLMDFSNGSGFK